MIKQTSIEWLFAHLVPHLDWSKVEDRELFRKLKEESKQMHKDEIEKAFHSGDSMHYEKHPLLKDVDKDGHEYYNQTYGGNNG